jgi:hypothetical protein
MNQLKTHGRRADGTRPSLFECSPNTPILRTLNDSPGARLDAQAGLCNVRVQIYRVVVLLVCMNQCCVKFNLFFHRFHLIAYIIFDHSAVKKRLHDLRNELHLCPQTLSVLHRYVLLPCSMGQYFVQGFGTQPVLFNAKPFEWIDKTARGTRSVRVELVTSLATHAH